MRIQRRGSERVSCAENVQIRRGRSTESTALVDISEGGACIESTMPIAPGESLVLFLPLRIHGTDKSRFCLLEGTVAWSSEGRAGIAFDSLPAETQLQLALGIETLRGNTAA